MTPESSLLLAPAVRIEERDGALDLGTRPTHPPLELGAARLTSRHRLAQHRHTEIEEAVRYARELRAYLLELDEALGSVHSVADPERRWGRDRGALGHSVTVSALTPPSWLGSASEELAPGGAISGAVG